MKVLGSHFVVAATTIFPSTLLITYCIAVFSDHVYPLMPFMSYTGDLPIESCIFSFGVNVSAALYLAITFLRYNQISNVSECAESEEVHQMNRIALKWGVRSSLGLSVTASFQQFNAHFVHLFGAAVCSYSAFAYFCYQTVLSRKLVGKTNGIRVVYFRAFLCLSDAAFLLSVPLLLLYLDLIYSKSHAETICWSYAEEGWYIHLCSSIVEWLLFLSNEAYTMSFYGEFKKIRIRADGVYFNEG